MKLCLPVAIRTRCLASLPWRRSPAPGGYQREIDQNRQYHDGHRPEAPLPAVPVLDRRVPEQRGGEEEEAHDGHERRRKEPVESVGEKPEQNDQEPRSDQGKQEQQAGHSPRITGLAANP